MINYYSFSENINLYKIFKISYVYHWWYTMQVIAGKSVPHVAHDAVNALSYNCEASANSAFFHTLLFNLSNTNS